MAAMEVSFFMGQTDPAWMMYNMELLGQPARDDDVMMCHGHGAWGGAGGAGRRVRPPPKRWVCI